MIPKPIKKTQKKTFKKKIRKTFFKIKNYKISTKKVFLNKKIIIFPKNIFSKVHFLVPKVFVFELPCR